MGKKRNRKQREVHKLNESFFNLKENEVENTQKEMSSSPDEPLENKGLEEPLDLKTPELDGRAQGIFYADKVTGAVATIDWDAIDEGISEETSHNGLEQYKPVTKNHKLFESLKRSLGKSKVTWKERIANLTDRQCKIIGVTLGLILGSPLIVANIWFLKLLIAEWTSK